MITDPIARTLTERYDPESIKRETGSKMFTRTFFNPHNASLFDMETESVTPLKATCYEVCPQHFKEGATAPNELDWEILERYFQSRIQREFNPDGSRFVPDESSRAIGIINLHHLDANQDVSTESILETLISFFKEKGFDCVAVTVGETDVPYTIYISKIVYSEKKSLPMGSLLMTRGDVHVRSTSPSQKEWDVLKRLHPDKPLRRFNYDEPLMR